MKVFKTILVLATNLRIVFSKCGDMPKDIQKQQGPLDCCLIPSFFTEDDFEACGFNDVNFGHKNHGHGYPWDNAPSKKVKACARQNCVLNRYGMRKKDEDKLDFEKVGEFLDKWAETHQEYFYLIGVAKDKCFAGYESGYCLFDRLAKCISEEIFVECPKWSDTDYCLALKDYNDYCKEKPINE